MTQIQCVAVVACLGVAFAVGCTRTHYSLQADNDAYTLVNQKYSDPRWTLDNYSIEIDPRSRYFDPYCEEHPPMPEDDPYAHEYMHFVDHKKGWPHWEDDGFRPDLTNSAWRDALAEYVPLNEQGEVILNLDSSLELAYVHSPSYQTQLETLYLSALDVSTERFRLDTQFFGGFDLVYTHNGDRRPGGERNSLVLDGGALGANSLATRRRFATAGELLIGFANSIVWNFTGNDSNFTTSILNMSVVQPLLRGAGRDVALEQLTIVERGLLSNVRAMKRYREGFFTQVAIGDLGVSGPQRRGGFFGGTGLTGFTGTGGGGFGGVGAATGFGRGGFGGAGGGGGAGGAGFAGGGAGTVGGFIGLLQQLQQLRNAQDSLTLQLRTLNLLEAYLDSGVIDLVQVDQFRQNIETERATLLQSTNALENSLESFKTGTLGLPPDLPVVLDDSLIQQFQLIDPRATELQNEIGLFQDQIGVLPENPTTDEIMVAFSAADALLERVGAQLARVGNDLDQLEDRSPARESRMEPEEQSLFEREKAQLHDGLAELRETFEVIAPQIDAMRSQFRAENTDESIGRLVVWTSDLYRLVQVSILVQARARLESIVVDPINITAEEAFRVAWENRLDIMNNRAALVDTWRLIAFNADALRGNLDIVFNGDMRTTRNNPFSFVGSTGQMSVGLQYDAPFERLLERNNFRQSLIDYQRDRRQFIQFRDGVNQGMRALVRQLEELRLNLEIQRRAVAISIRRVDLTREELNEPVPPQTPGQAAPSFGPTAALNLLTALSDLRNTQNNFMSVWLNYYANRMRLVREMGIMVIDEDGRWIDEPIPDVIPYYDGEELPLPPPVPVEWFETVSLSDVAMVNAEE